MITAILAAASLVKSGMDAYSQREAGDQAQRVAEYNARVAEAEALQKQLETTENYRRLKIQAKAFSSRQRMQYAKGGVVSNTGSALEVMSETVGMMEMQAQDMARSGRADVSRLLTNAKLTRLTGKNQRDEAYAQSISTILGGALNAAGSYYGMTRG